MTVTGTCLDANCISCVSRRRIMCANSREKPTRRNYYTMKSDWSDPLMVAPTLPARAVGTEKIDLNDPKAPEVSVKVTAELARLEGAVQLSSSKCYAGQTSNNDLQGNTAGTEDTNTEEDIDVLGVSCDTDIFVAIPTTAVRSSKQTRNGVKELRDEFQSGCKVAETSAETRPVFEGACTSGDSQRGDRSPDVVESMEEDDVSQALSAKDALSDCGTRLHFTLPLEDPRDFEDDNYNRFYFESDHMALKGNKHYQVLLQSLVALEAQRAQAIKDLDILCEMQNNTLCDPIRFVEKLQNNEPVNLPGRQKVVKVPHVPWEEYAMSLGPLERQNLFSHHQTRSTAQQLEKVLSATQSLESEDTRPAVPDAPSITTNVYSVFGGEFVASKTGRTLERDGLSSALFGGQTDWRSRSFDETKPSRFNQAWTSEEQAKLERLLQTYPQEEVEAKRWEKVATALGNRTPKQVASRVQKYFIKLAKAGLPVPGRAPSLPKPGSRSKRSSHYQTLGFRNSTFFPSYQPRVYMNDEDDASSVALSDDTSYPSDDESVPSDLKETDEYRELMLLKKMKRQKLHNHDQRHSSLSQHHGFMCDACGMNPIVGLRFHCQDCPQDSSVDLCADCVDRGMVTSGSHQPTHRMETINMAAPFFVDGDYVDYNYLDTNFLPAAS